MEKEKSAIEANLVIGLLNCQRNIELLLGTERIQEIIREMLEVNKERMAEREKNNVNVVN